MKVKFGSIIVSGRGTLGGHVYSENRYGPFARTKVTPLNPQTESQQTVRNNFETVQTEWRNLTQAQRDAWNLATADYPQIDYSGTVYFLSGYNLFIKLNVPHLINVGSILVSPPTKTIPTSDTSGTPDVNFGVGGFRYSFDAAPNETDVVTQFFSTRPLSAGINYISTELRLIFQQPADASSVIDLTTPWTNKFGVAPDVGQKIFVKAVPLNIETGDYGVPFISSGIQYI